MLDLWITSLLWAFSFGLIKTRLAGVDSTFVAAARMVLALLVFLPFFRPRGLSRRMVWHLLGIGALQYGLMYIAYIASFRFLPAWQVALFTVFTPIYVTLLGDLGERRFQPYNLLTAVLAVLGTALIVHRAPVRGMLVGGFLLVQVSNLCFAAGQILYRALLAGRPQVQEHRLFALPYLGAVFSTLPALPLLGDARALPRTPGAWLTLVYLGVLASGLAFFLWNRGARRVGTGVLAVFNNVKVPLAVLVSLLVFGETAHLPSLAAGGAVIALAFLLQRRRA